MTVINTFKDLKGHSNISISEVYRNTSKKE